MVIRFLESTISSSLFKNKVILLLGARQTGKTTLLKKIASQNENVLWLNGDEYDIQERFKNATSTQLKALIGNNKMLIIDEAQRIENIGLSLKIIHDTYPEIQIIATGSSAFELKNKTNEPLTGRKFEYQLFPISYAEMANHHSELIETRYIKTRLIFGYYPEIINNEGNEIDILKFLADSYLFKDILMLDTIKKPEKLVKLLQALAFQLGSEVSYNEIGNLIGLDSKTVETYINLLEKSFIVFKLNSLNRNLRNELKMAKKIYFYDNGIRNALISNYQIIEARQDAGALFENLLVSERMKRNHYAKNYANTYFWRTKEQQEIDYIEDKDGQIDAFEFKWNNNKKVKFTKTFTNAYPNATTQLINSENFASFLI
ncbi:ATP-binding protein [Flavobacterium sp.]|uniref:ATP-binding protein n=1 Tax=Flavobacterium sp. TaxID=239 RepID=UPI00286E590B|nr:ATP-binding protein [Flavobacterium sp.]